MSLVMGQVTVPGNSTVQVFVLPPGTVNTTMYLSTAISVQPVFVGTSVNVSSVNGMQIGATPVNAESYVTSRGTPVWATSGNATATTFQYIISGGG